MVDQYYVIGNPLHHTLSPIIHSEFAKQTNQILAYNKCCLPIGGLKQAMVSFQENGVKGLNVTLPFKEKIIEFVDELDISASVSGAVNTVLFQECGKIEGYNTDGSGFIDDITQRCAQVIQGKKVLVLGAGGAAAGVLPVLVAQNPALLQLYNRTKERATLLVHRQKLDSSIEIIQKLPSVPQFDIIINATSSSLFNKLPDGFNAKLIDNTTFVYDLAYDTNKPTSFCQFTKEHGAKKVTDGLGMLLSQAAEAFYLWRGVRPEANVIYNQFSPRCKLTDKISMFEE